MTTKEALELLILKGELTIAGDEDTLLRFRRALIKRKSYVARTFDEDLGRLTFEQNGNRLTVKLTQGHEYDITLVED